MNYSDLPIEERIEKAAEYGLMLVGDERLQVDIIAEMQSMFTLTHEQAQQAYTLMRKKHGTEYKAAVQKKIRLFLAMLFTSLVIGGFYMLMGAELGWGFYILAAIFGISVVAVFGGIVSMWYEKSLSPQKFLSQKKQPVIIPEGGKLNGIPMFFFFMLMVTGIMAIVQYRVVNTDDLVKLDGLTIANKVQRKSTGGKNKSYYYSFYFKEYSNEFRMESNIYRYGKWKTNQDDFRPGDTVSIETKKKYLQRLSQADEPGRVYMYNIRVGKQWLIDHEERNRRIKWEDRRAVYLFGLGLLISIIGVRLWYKYKADKNQVLADEFSRSRRE